MGWNSGNSNTASSCTLHSKQQAKFVKLLVIFLCLACLTTLVIWGFFSVSSDEHDVKDLVAKGPIQDFHPTLSEDRVEKKSSESVMIDPDVRPTKVGEEVNGYIKLPSGRIHKVKGVITNSSASVSHAKYAIFDYHCENEIAGILSAVPGQGAVGTPVYNGKFKKEFLESLKHPIIVNDDDTPEQAELKRAVIEAKIELKDALDRGEDIEKLMLDARKELQELSIYKLHLQE